MRAALARAIASFRRAAPPAARLIVKPHPLDPMLTPWRRLAADPRTIWLDGGPIAPLTPRLSGVVVVNSTVGLSALRDGLPVAALGSAIYEDLCWRGDLDGFWRDPPPPDPAAVARFVAGLAAEIQTPGAFDGPGMAPGSQGVAELILRRAPMAAS
jgi:capsular polysaccharide export protein